MWLEVYEVNIIKVAQNRYSALAAARIKETLNAEKDRYTHSICWRFCWYVSSTLFRSSSDSSLYSWVRILKSGLLMLSNIISSILNSFFVHTTSCW